MARQAESGGGRTSKPTPRVIDYRDGSSRYTTPKTGPKNGLPDDVLSKGRIPQKPVVIPPKTKDPVGTTNGNSGNGSPGKKPPAKPSLPGPRVQKGKDVKVATKELFVTEDKTVGEILATQKIFQEIGGMELLSVARNYSIDGSTQTYNPIANIANISEQYSPFNIIPLQGIDREYFNQYDIDLGRHIPDFPANPDGSRYNVYVDLSNNIVIDLTNVAIGERVDIEFLTTEDLIGWYN